jgi:hypothetical protein
MDPGWETVDEVTQFTPQEFEAYEMLRHEIDKSVHGEKSLYDGLHITDKDNSLHPPEIKPPSQSIHHEVPHKQDHNPYLQYDPKDFESPHQNQHQIPQQAVHQESHIPQQVNHQQVPVQSNPQYQANPSILHHPEIPQQQVINPNVPSYQQYQQQPVHQESHIPQQINQRPGQPDLSHPIHQFQMNSHLDRKDLVPEVQVPHQQQQIHQESHIPQQINQGPGQPDLSHPIHQFQMNSHLDRKDLHPETQVPHQQPVHQESYIPQQINQRPGQVNAHFNQNQHVPHQQQPVYQEHVIQH